MTCPTVGGVLEALRQGHLDGDRQRGHGNLPPPRVEDGRPHGPFVRCDCRPTAGRCAHPGVLRCGQLLRSVPTLFLGRRPAATHVGTPHATHPSGQVLRGSHPPCERLARRI